LVVKAKCVSRVCGIVALIRLSVGGRLRAYDFDFDTPVVGNKAMAMFTENRWGAAPLRS